MSLEDKLSAIYTDMLMLKTGQWQPEEHSIQATIVNIEEIADELNVELIDLREENGKD